MKQTPPKQEHSKFLNKSEVHAHIFGRSSLTSSTNAGVLISSGTAHEFVPCSWRQASFRGSALSPQRCEEHAWSRSEGCLGRKDYNKCRHHNFNVPKHGFSVISSSSNTCHGCYIFHGRRVELGVDIIHKVNQARVSRSSLQEMPKFNVQGTKSIGRRNPVALIGKLVR